MRYKLLLIITITIITGCSSALKYEISPEWDQTKLATVTIYRTSTYFHSLNPEKPFFYIDGMMVGKLGTGMDVTIKATADKHVITVRDPILFMPGFEIERIECQFEANKTYYLRYSREFSGTSLTLANEIRYLDKR